MQRSTKTSSAALLSLLLWLGSALLLTGCGYHHPGAVRSDLPPMQLAISNWQNQTSELGIEAEFLQELTRWCSKASIISLTDAPDAQYFTSAFFMGFVHRISEHLSRTIGDPLFKNFLGHLNPELIK